MAETQPSIADEVERYLRSGDTDPYHTAWPGGFLERARRAGGDLRGALVREVQRLAQGRTQHPLPAGDLVVFTRARVEPMLRGFFPRSERDAVLGMLERSVVFLTDANIERCLLEQHFDASAWAISNLYLASLGAELLGEEAPRIVGMSEATTCYVSPEYFAETDPFSDFIVHEAAHVFHNCKRRTVGLRETRTREWLLDIEFRKREVFAYACEAYACVLRRGNRPAERRALADDYGAAVRIADERVEPAEVADLVREAASVRNGWKLILSRCAPTRAARAQRAAPRAVAASAIVHSLCSTTDPNQRDSTGFANQAYRSENFRPTRSER